MLAGRGRIQDAVFPGDRLILQCDEEHEFETGVQTFIVNVTGSGFVGMRSCEREFIIICQLVKFELAIFNFLTLSLRSNHVKLVRYWLHLFDSAQMIICYWLSCFFMGYCVIICYLLFKRALVKSAAQ